MTNYQDNCLNIIKENLDLITKQLTTAPKARPTNDIKAAVSKIHNLVLINHNPIERFYFITSLCKLCSNEKPNKVDKLMKVILPPSPTPQSIELISDIISLALCHPSNCNAILDNLSSYMSGSDMIKIFIESWCQANSLALASPSFCSALLSRQDLPQMGIPKQLLAKWLQDLSKMEQGFAHVNLSQLIKISLVGGLDSSLTNDIDPQQPDKATKSTDTIDSDLHFSILTLIQSRRCLTLTNQFLIEIANTLAEKVDTIDARQNTLILDRFGQILAVAAASKATSITSSLRSALNSLDSNQLIAAVIKWQNK